MSRLPLEPEEKAILRLLLDAAIGDHFTVTELAACATAAGHAPVAEDVVREVLLPLVRCGYADRVAKHQRGGRQWAYALTLAGRILAVRKLR